MNYFRFIIVFSIVIHTQSLFANECSFSTNGQGVPTMNSGGASISTHFSSHLTNQNQEIMALLEGAESLDGFRASIDEYIAQPDNAARIREERADVARLVQSAESGRLQWLGLEISPGELSNGASYEAMVADYTGLRSTFSDILTPEQTDAVMHLMYSPDIIARADNPGAFRNIRNVALDDTEQKALGNDYLRMMDEGYDSLIDLGMAGHMTPDQFVAFRDYVNSGLENNRRFTDEEIDAYVAQFEHPGIRSAVYSNLYLLNSFLDTSDARSRTAARRAIQQPGDGLITFGSAHGPLIQQELQRLCHDRAKTEFIMPQPGEVTIPNSAGGNEN